MQEIVSSIFTGHFPSIAIHKIKPASGGCINEAFHVYGSDKHFFIKINNVAEYPKMFELEYDGLEALQETHTIKVPRPILYGKYNQYQYLIMEGLSPQKPDLRFFEALGHGLAELHRTTSTHYGYDIHNYIGSISQSNRLNKDWEHFFIEERLIPLVKKAHHLSLIPDDYLRHFDRFYQSVPELFPPCKPSLLHGDLWSGNVLYSMDGHAYVLDPAVYYGHPEMELAFTTLFGGFDEVFYTAYFSVTSDYKDFRKRAAYYNLYPLLVHLILFGESYWWEIRRTLEKFN